MIPVENFEHPAYNLMNQNHEPEAKRRREIWNNNRLEGNLYFFWGCGDARMLRLLAEETMVNNTIGNGGKADRMQGAVNRAKLGLVIAHRGCGALSAKTDQVKNSVHLPTEDDLHEFISNDIKHPDPLQACMQADILSRHTRTEIAAILQNPTNGNMEVMAIFNRKDGGITSHIPSNLYAPANRPAVSESEIKYLSEDELSEEVRAYLEKFNVEAQRLFTDFPNLSREQLVQNPPYLGSSDSLKPQEIRYPRLWKPNTMFRLTIPRKREEKSTGEAYTVVDQQDLRVARRQAQYVVSHAIANRDKPHAPFADTRTALFEASTHQNALNAAMEYAQHPTMQPFFSEEGNKIIIAENKGGEIVKMGEWRFTIEDGRLIRAEEVYDPDKHRNYR